MLGLSFEMITAIIIAITLVVVILNGLRTRITPKDLDETWKKHLGELTDEEKGAGAIDTGLNDEDEYIASEYKEKLKLKMVEEEIKHKIEEKKDTLSNILSKYFLIALFLSAPALLLYASFYEGSYSYFQFLRVYIFFFCGYFAVITMGGDKYYTDSRHIYTFMFITIAILFNPIFEIHLSKDIWKIFDLMSGIALMFYYIERRISHKKRKQ